MRSFRKPLLVLAVAALLVVAVWSLRGWFGYLAASHWRPKLDDVPAEQAELLARRIAKLGKPGIEALVDAMGSEREAAATAARRALWAELERWEPLSAPAVTRNLAVLAEALAQNADRFSPAARRDAVDLATEILRWLPESDAVDRVAVVANCDRVFELTASDRHETAATAAFAFPERTAAAQPSFAEKYDPVPARPALEKPDMPSALTAMPGGGLPIETWPLPGGDAHSRAESTADPRSRASGPEPAADEESAASPRLSTPGELFLPEGVRSLSATGMIPQAPQPRILPDEIANSLAGIEGEPEPDEEFDTLETDVLMRWLQSVSAATAARAEAALRRRGFTDVEVELARRLFDPDPDVRVELARTLPKLASIDPTPWLLWLSRDPHAEVRVAAIGLMATTNDPALHDRIRQMAREDSDAAVQRIARRLDER